MKYWDNGNCQLYHADAREIPLPMDFNPGQPAVTEYEGLGPKW